MPSEKPRHWVIEENARYSLMATSREEALELFLDAIVTKHPIFDTEVTDREVYLDDDDDGLACEVCGDAIEGDDQFCDDCSDEEADDGT